jgi:hypothetical protein
MRYPLPLAPFLLTAILSACAAESTPSRATGPEGNAHTTPTPPRAPGTVPTPTARPTLVEACVTVPSLRVRAGPGPYHSLIGGVLEGDCWPLDGRTSDNSWVRTTSNAWLGQRHGWLSASYVDVLGPLDTLPVRAADPAATAAPSVQQPPQQVQPAAQAGPSNCHPSYPSVCIPIGSADYDCAGGSGNGPNYVRGPIPVRHDVPDPDPHDLDRNHDGVGCE